MGSSPTSGITDPSWIGVLSLKGVMMRMRIVLAAVLLLATAQLSHAGFFCCGGGKSCGWSTCGGQSYSYGYGCGYTKQCCTQPVTTCPQGCCKGVCPADCPCGCRPQPQQYVYPSRYTYSTCPTGNCPTGKCYPAQNYAPSRAWNSGPLPFGGH